jgi:hypothetical protein
MPSTTDVQVSTLKDRVIKILTNPKAEWPVIEAESTDVAKLYREYIAILAAIPAICSFIGLSLIGVTMPFVGTFRIGVASGLAHVIVQYALALVGVYVSALIIDKLAPSFESKPDQLQALKLVAYASTPAWLAGVFNIIPALGIIGLLISLYAIYLFYLGLPVLMKTPQAKVIPYMVVAAIVVIVVTVVFNMIAAAVTGFSVAARGF